MTDSQIKNETFLEDIDNLLNSGEVPNIFSAEERAEVIELVQSTLEAESRKNTQSGGGRIDIDLSPMALFAAFVNRCRANLHIIIAFSPIGSAFRNRLRMFPSLINCCTIDWFRVSWSVFLSIYWNFLSKSLSDLCYVR